MATRLIVGRDVAWENSVEYSTDGEYEYEYRDAEYEYEVQTKTQWCQNNTPPVESLVLLASK